MRPGGDGEVYRTTPPRLVYEDVTGVLVSLGRDSPASGRRTTKPQPPFSLRTAISPAWASTQPRLLLASARLDGDELALDLRTGETCRGTDGFNDWVAFV
jgi:hypothetical protein